APGEYLALWGPSGCGKSTLLNLVAGLALPTAGQVLVEGGEIGGQTEAERALMRQHVVAVVFQSDNLLPRLTVRENVELPLRLTGAPAASMSAREALAAVGLGDLGGRYPGQLSGGERQRVAFATAIATHPRVLLADEVTGELDRRNGEIVLDLMDQLNRERSMTILAVTHSPVAAARAHRRVVMLDGRIVDGGPEHD
ncbi:MAG: ABC transporter ATP-binding protein, partial [Dehalococcoidia bacterium]